MRWSTLLGVTTACRPTVSHAIAGANLLTLWALPAKAASTVAPLVTPVGVFGLFLVGLLFPRMLSKPLEVLCLAPFVCMTLLSRWVQPSN